MASQATCKFYCICKRVTSVYNNTIKNSETVETFVLFELKRKVSIINMFELVKCIWNFQFTFTYCAIIVFNTATHYYMFMCSKMTYDNDNIHLYYYSSVII